eukprot:c8675_g1_i1.p1 GENE.c8675_g1_i1~~c8675_g1_i1.p1  ORF type:complete len:1034 (+),score=210.50 c8675_g1_i1:650-3751(+)
MSSRIQWRDYCTANKFKFPKEIILKNPAEQGSANVRDGWLLATVLEDGAMVIAQQQKPTVREAREELARSCLEFVKLMSSQSPPDCAPSIIPHDLAPPSSTIVDTSTASSCSIYTSISTGTASSVATSSDDTASSRCPSPVDELITVEPVHEQSPREDFAPDAQQVESLPCFEENTFVAEPPSAMHSSANIRNVSIIAHVDHGKTTLSDSLLSASGYLNSSKAGEACALDVGQEAERGITINSTAITLQFPISCLPSYPGAAPASTSNLVVNMIDSPGHVDFNSDVITALRVTDGAIVVVDVVEGVCVQTEMVVRQALNEGVRLVLVLNKVDRLISQMRLSDKEIFHRMQIVVSEVNELISAVCNERPSAPRPPALSLSAGNVCFGSGYFGWMACAHTIACLYARGGTSEADAAERHEKAFKRLCAVDETGSPRASSIDAFCRLALNPTMQIQSLVETVPRPQSELTRLLSKVGVNVSAGELEMPSRQLLKLLLGRLLPASQCLIHLISKHLPGPHDAQSRKCASLYTGPFDDPFAKGIRSCDPIAPLVMFVCKMIPMPGSRNNVALGRVLSGTIKSGMNVLVMVRDDGNDKDGDADAIDDDVVETENNNSWEHAPQHKFKTSTARISRVLTVLGHGFSSTSSASAGMVCGVMGLDQVLTTSGTIAATQPANAFPITTMRFAVRPIVRVAVRAIGGGQGVNKLIQALDTLRRIDPGVRCILDEDTKEHIIAATGELHVEVCVTELRRLCEGVELWVSPARVSHRESVSKSSSIECLVKTANKHNRFWFRASPLGEGLVKDICRGAPALSGKDNIVRARFLSDSYGWDNSHARKVIAMGGEFGPNALIDCTSGVQHMTEVRELVVAAFQKLVGHGPLCGERLFGIRIDIVDAKVHHESAQRRAPQVVPAALRGMAAAILSACPVLVEPWLKADIRAGEEECGSVFSALSTTRARVVPTGNEKMSHVLALVPVVESRILVTALRETTRGRALVSCTFAKWGEMEPQESSVRVLEIRGEKGLQGPVSDPEQLVDRL